MAQELEQAATTAATVPQGPSLPERMKELTRQLEEGVRDIFTSGKYASYLQSMSSFHQYSFRNSLLIFQQNPDATRVAGFGTWKEMGRSVKKGEKGLTILAPAPYKKQIENDKGEKEEIVIPSFRPVKVFDLSQTWGEPLPSLTQRLGDTWGKELSADEAVRAEHYRAGLLRCLERISPVPVHYEPIARENANGFFDPEENRIVIRPDISQTQTVKTLIHEVTHARLHSGDDVDHVTAEIQAESVAYITCQHFGIDSSQYSFGYLARWSKDMELSVLQNSLKVIQREAHAIVTEVTAELTVELEVLREETREEPELNPGHARQAEALINAMEAGESLFGPQERDQIINFAYQTGSIDETEIMTRELALRGFEQRRGYADPAFGQLMEQRIEQLRAGAEPQSIQSLRDQQALHEQAIEARLEAEVGASFNTPDAPKASITDKLREGHPDPIISKQIEDHAQMLRQEKHEHDPYHPACAKQAETMIERLENDAQRTLFGKDELNQIVNFAYQTGNLQETELMAKELATRGFEVRCGWADPSLAISMELRAEELRTDASPSTSERLQENLPHKSAPKPSLSDRLKVAKETCTKQPQREPHTQPARLADVTR